MTNTPRKKEGKNHSKDKDISQSIVREEGKSELIMQGLLRFLMTFLIPSVSVAAGRFGTSVFQLIILKYSIKIHDLLS